MPKNKCLNELEKNLFFSHLAGTFWNHINKTIFLVSNSVEDIIIVKISTLVKSVINTVFTSLSRFFLSKHPKTLNNYLVYFFAIICFEFKGALSGLKQFLAIESPFDGNSFLFHLKNSFRSQDLWVLILTFWLCRKKA